MTTVEVIQPCPWLAINDRNHWAIRNARVEEWRRAAHVYSRGVQPVPGTVEVHAVIHKPTRVQYDLDGAAATVKACIDGLRDAKVIDEDNAGVVVRLVITNGEPVKPGRVVLTITSLETAKVA